MQELNLFESTEFGQLEVILIDGKEFFPATACAKVLGYKNPEKAIITQVIEWILDEQPEQEEINRIQNEVYAAFQDVA